MFDIVTVVGDSTKNSKAPAATATAAVPSSSSAPFEVGSEGGDALSMGIELLWQLIESLPSSQSMAKLMKAGLEPACTEGGLFSSD